MTAIYEKVRSQIRDGDTVLIRDGGWIGRSSDTGWVHTGKCFWTRDKDGCRLRLMMGEFRFKGSQIVTLSSQVRAYPSKITIYRPDCTSKTAFLSGHLMAGQAGQPYNKWAIRRIALMRFSAVRALTGWRYDTRDLTLAPEISAKICSQAVIWCDRSSSILNKENHKFYPCPQIADWYVQPEDIATDGDYDRQDDMRGLVLREAA